MTDTQALLSELARVKAEFQLRAIVAAMGGPRHDLKVKRDGQHMGVQVKTLGE